jgi:hypothetical protein
MVAAPFPAMQVQGRLNDLLRDPDEDAAYRSIQGTGLRPAARGEDLPEGACARPEQTVGKDLRREGRGRWTRG